MEFKSTHMSFNKLYLRYLLWNKAYVDEKKPLVKYIRHCQT